MKHIYKIALGIFVLISLVSSVHADILRKRNGQVLDGKFAGGTEYAVYFHTQEGTVEIPVDEILSISFLPSSAPLPKRTPMPTPIPTPTPGIFDITLPADTRLSVRLLKPLDSLVSRSGDQFDTRLEFDVAVDEIIVFPKDAQISGVVVRSEQGKEGSALVIELREVRVSDRVVPIKTSSYAMWDLPSSADDTTLRTIRTLSIPADTLLSFKLLEPVTVSLE
jgi:hypothetical protein